MSCLVLSALRALRSRTGVLNNSGILRPCSWNIAMLRKVGFGSLLVQIHHPALLLLVRVSSP